MDEHPASLAIGVDIGATKIACALVTSQGQVLVARQVATQAGQGPAAVLDRIAAQIDELIAGAADQAGSTYGGLVGIGVGAPGVVDSSQGLVRNAVNLGWQEIYLTREIASRLQAGIPIVIQKDANASALGEHYFGAGRGCQDLVYLGIGSGLGAGILSHGLLVTGADWYAAELGHLTLDPQGLPCICGKRGCAETLVSGPGLLNLTRKLCAERRYATRLRLDETSTSAEIVTAARAGDELAVQALNGLGRALGIVMAACAAILNPALVVLGGGLGLAAFEWIAAPARQELAQRVPTISHARLHIVPSQQASSAVGAACLVWYYQATVVGRYSIP